MKPAEIRSELLRQHEAVRSLLKATRACAKRALSGQVPLTELRLLLERVNTEVCAHNFNEEVLLRDMLCGTDAWGPLRAAFMSEEHLQEHARLRTAIHALQTAPIELAGVGVVALVDWIAEHIDREEAVFLHAEVLRDDVVVPDQSDG